MPLLSCRRRLTHPADGKPGRDEVAVPSEFLETRLHDLGDFIRDQRRNARLSLRKLSELAGISNPYLSQIERGLRKPSAEVLQQLAKALRVSAETLYVRAGILNLDDSEVRSVELAVLADSGLTERQKQSLLDVYTSFRAANVASQPNTGGN